MRKVFRIILSLLISVLLFSCASSSGVYFAGLVGGVYISADDYTRQSAEVNNSFSDLKHALWMIYGSKTILRPSEMGAKVLFYNMLDNGEFQNQFIPANYRATSVDEAGFVVIAEKTDGIYFNEYSFEDGSKCKVYKGAAILKLYSMKTGDVLYTSEKIQGPKPPKSMSVYGNPSSVTFDMPSGDDFVAELKSICTKLSSGKISSSIPDNEVMEPFNSKKSRKADKNIQDITGIWEAKTKDDRFVYKFTDIGICVFEHYVNGVLENVNISSYTYDKNYVVIDGAKEGYNISGKKLTFRRYSSSVVFKQTDRKAKLENSSKNLYGIWTEKDFDSSILLGLTNDGFSIFYGSNNGMSAFRADASSLRFYDYSQEKYDYWMINGILYIKDKGYFGTDRILRFERKTSEGKDSTSQSVLSSDEWQYVQNSRDWQISDRKELSGNTYSFNSKGVFTDIPFRGNRNLNQVSGRYSFDSHVIKLSDGRRLAFAYIDGYVIGYTISN